MKKPILILIISFIVITSALVGCKLDDAGFTQNSINKDNLAIVGIWYMKTMIQSDPISGTHVDTVFTPQNYFLFTDNKITMSFYPDTVVSGRYQYNPANRKLKVGDPDNFDTDFDIWTISKLTNDSLIILSTNTASQTGGPVTVSNVTYKLSRK
jgi:hypothetical protein